MQNYTAGVLKWVVLMRGAKFIALKMTKNAVVGSFVLPVFGVPQKMRVIMPNKSNEWLITVALEKSQMTRNSHARI